jgi:hypothetical protein
VTIIVLAEFFYGRTEAERSHYDGQFLCIGDGFLPGVQEETITEL